MVENLPAIAAPKSNQTFPRFDLSAWGLGRSDLAPLSAFDMPSLATQPLLRTLRYANTLADTLFYDVGVFWLRLYTRGITVSTKMTEPGAGAETSVASLQAAANFINLSALANPEGSILVIDAHRPPFVYRYTDVQEFLAHGLAFPNPADSQALGVAPKDVGIVTVTGVGSSALGSAAFAWNVSEATHKPVAAIIPGYGLADIVPQALGGWFGFGVHDILRRMAQQTLAATMPHLAKVGHHLAATTPEAEARQAGEAFRTGSPESDILHDILAAAPGIRRLYGHSKGALCIQNAIRSLSPERYEDLHVTTFGCVVEEEQALVDYNQILGDIDCLGQLNSWGNWPEMWITSWHSTNSMLPATMRVSDMVTKDVRAEDPVNIDPAQLRAALGDALKALLRPDLLAERPN